MYLVKEILRWMGEGNWMEGVMRKGVGFGGLGVGKIGERE